MVNLKIKYINKIDVWNTLINLWLRCVEIKLTNNIKYIKIIEIIYIKFRIDETRK